MVKGGQKVKRKNVFKKAVNVNQGEWGRMLNSHGKKELSLEPR